MAFLRALLSSSLRFLRVTFLWIILIPHVFIYSGMISNQLVLWTNHDTFPVLMRDSAAQRLLPDDQGHVAMTRETHLNFLGDVFDFHDGWESLGDLMLETGMWMNTFAPYVFLALVIPRLVASSNASSMYARGQDIANENSRSR
jgi:hypothetical protein